MYVQCVGSSEDVAEATEVFFVALHVVGSYKLVTAAMFGVSKFKRPCVRAKPSGFAVQLLNTSLVSPAKPEKSGLLQCGR